MTDNIDSIDLSNEEFTIKGDEGSFIPHLDREGTEDGRPRSIEMHLGEIGLRLDRDLCRESYDDANEMMNVIKAMGDTTKDASVFYQVLLYNMVFEIEAHSKD